jgi:hypothetical protein
VKRRKPFRDLTDETFGRLKVLYRAEGCKRTSYVCECTCGTFPTVQASSLLGKPGRATRSCGCLRKEIAVNKIETGICERLFKHGCATQAHQAREYVAWLNARRMYEKVPDFLEFFKMIGSAFPGARLHRLPDGRFAWGRGLKLSIEKVREIRALAAQGMTKKALAQQFGVGKSIVSSIVLNQKWREAA